MFPFADIIAFSLAYVLAFLNRRNAAAHKRFMLLAGILMIDPAMARLMAALGAPGVAIPLTELALFLALPVYDWRARGRPHWASMLGLSMFMVMSYSKTELSQSEWWINLAPVLFG